MFFTLIGMEDKINYSSCCGVLTYFETVANRKSMGTVAGSESNLMPRCLNNQLAKPLLACSI